MRQGSERQEAVKRAAILFTALVLGAGAVAPIAFADQPPGQLGYEGQPGNQGGASGNPGANGTSPGLQGYEGQPGNQGG
jgi:hypothetical protein